MGELFQITDKQLVEQMQKGDQKAFKMLFDRYSRRLYSFALSHLKGQVDAEELVQDVFVKLWDKKEYLRSEGNIKAYIFRVAVNTVYDIVKKRKSESAYHEFIQQQDAHHNSTWDQVVFEELQQRHDSLVAEMPEKRREIYLMSRNEGLSNKEIAEKLDVSVRTVESQIYKAVSFLKEHLLKNSFITTIFYYLFVL
ncbi:RNA polymerase sigma-70 factor [Puteibacter caeruleilacunae]|nr:RNA polymerase sigma-70 factor [Puteibacter caeruleilacunae]